MKFGACIGTDCDRLKAIKALGFDYAESSCGSVNAITEEEFEAFAALREELGVCIPVANGFFPKNIKLVGPEKDEAVIRAYMEKLITRASRLGIQRFIFGSGGARRIPDGMSAEEGLNGIIDTLKTIICPMCAANGMEVVIEPLRTEECNILNTVHEGVDCMAKAQIPNLFVLADVYHMVEMGESYEDYLPTLQGKLKHAHTSNPIGGEERRCYPAPHDGFDQKPFVTALKGAGCETCSIEAGTDDFAKEAAIALAVLRAADIKD